MRTAFIPTALIAATAAIIAAAPAAASVALCVPTTAGQAAFSGGTAGGASCNGARTVLLPDSVDDQQKLIDLLPYVTFKASGIGRKPTLRFTGLNIQIAKKEYPGYGNVDGTGNLIIGDSGLRYSDQSITDNRYSGSENLIIGSANEWRGRASATIGERNRLDSTLSFVHGQNNTVSAFQGFVTGYNRTVSKSYAVIADGSGTDVHWARYDGTGKLVASSEPLSGGDSYAYGGPNYSLTKFGGVDTSKCAVSVQQEGLDGTNMTDVGSDYYGYVYARFYKTTAAGTQSATNVPHTIIVNCNMTK